MSKGIFKPCVRFGEQIVLIPDDKGKYKPVNTITYHGEDLYDREKHQIHFRTCVALKTAEDEKADKAGY